ncbi:hypothetical protein CPLU01_15435 [Colletotrichum plurivorum]|uniref:Uncharacterized protein n=1 Tax=Colletotrichum plurivorum TaxID=2175906 RepID=A0A8H6JBZ6_9PEZI|nr:hypothetical protein CPLU01_15435 [Colletotrichum plurivorum]
MGMELQSHAKELLESTTWGSLFDTHDFHNNVKILAMRSESEIMVRECERAAIRRNSSVAEACRRKYATSTDEMITGMQRPRI